MYPREERPDPTGKSAKNLSSPFAKNILIFRSRESLHIFAVPSHRGAARDRHGRGAGCGGRVGALDEQLRMRTAKSCGPDASTPASSPGETRFSRVTVTRKPDRRGEYDISRKTIARGMPGVSRCDLTTRVRSTTLIAHAAIGRIGRPAFPAPSDWRGRNEHSKTRAKPAARSRFCIPPSLRAQRSNPSRSKKESWIASLRSQ